MAWTSAATNDDMERAFLDVYDVLARGDGVRDDEVADRWRDLYDRLRQATQPPPESRCSRCGIGDRQAGWAGLMDVQVVVASGEEGFADVTQLLCDPCLEQVLNGLHALGFKDHRHGTSNLLEDRDCPGSGYIVGGVCPSPVPEEFDPYDTTYFVPPPS